MQCLSSSIRRRFASSPRSRCSWGFWRGGSLALLLGVGLAAAACAKSEVEIRGRENASGADYGLRALLDAAALSAEKPRSAEAYKLFADKVEALRPGFDESVAKEAELRLVFRALGPLAANEALPPAKRVALLATTVWPTALGVRSRPDETPHAYLSRVCQGKLASACKLVVPEEWGVMVGAVVWRRIKERAEAAYGECDQCARVPAYVAALASMRRYHVAAGAAAELRTARARPSDWPSSGPHARAYEGAPVFTVRRSGAAELDGVRVTGGSWIYAMKRARLRGPVLAVHLSGSDRVERLRAIMRDATLAGFEEVALLVRHPEYPFELCAYHLSLDVRRGQLVRARGVDPIQLLVQSLENASVGKVEPIHRI